MLVLGPMIAGTGVLALLAFKHSAFLDRLTEQHTRPEFGMGRFVEKGERGRTGISRPMLVMIVYMFGIYFIDSLGFLGLIFTPVYVNNARQSPQVGTLLFGFKWKVRSSLTAFPGTLLFMVVAMGIGHIPIAGSGVLVLSAAIGLGAVLVKRMGTRTYAPGKASVAVGGDEQQVGTPADPVTR